MPDTPFASPVRLTGDLVVLEPLRPDHHDGLVEAVQDGRLWRLWYTRIPAPPDMAAEIARRLDLQAQGSMLPFTVRRAPQGGADGGSGTDPTAAPAGPVIGMTTYMNIDAQNRRVEIGSTWTARSAQRSGTNTESKLLLLTHAFEVLGCIAVEFRTHRLNTQSRAAIERLGAQLDGILRQHLRMPNGTLRDTAVYSITDAEWPAVRANLQGRLELAGPDGRP